MQRQGRKSSSESREIKVQRTLPSNQLQGQPIKKVRCILKEILKDKMAENFPILMNIKILDIERNKTLVKGTLDKIFTEKNLNFLRGENIEIFICIENLPVVTQ